MGGSKGREGKQGFPKDLKTVFYGAFCDSVSFKAINNFFFLAYISRGARKPRKTTLTGNFDNNFFLPFFCTDID